MAFPPAPHRAAGVVKTASATAITLQLDPDDTHERTWPVSPTVKVQREGKAAAIGEVVAGDIAMLYVVAGVVEIVHAHAKPA